MFRKMFFDDKNWRNMAFQYLYPEGNPSLLLELTMNDMKNSSGRLEQVNQAVFEVIRAQGVSRRAQGIIQEHDYSPRWDCFYQDPRDFTSFFRF